MQCQEDFFTDNPACIHDNKETSTSSSDRPPEQITSLVFAIINKVLGLDLKTIVEGVEAEKADDNNRMIVTPSS